MSRNESSGFFVLIKETNLIEERGNIASAMQDANELDSIWKRAIENYVVASGQTAKVWGEIGSFPSEFRHPRKQLAFFINEIQPAVGGNRIFFGDAERRLDKIEMRLTGAQDNRHQLLLLPKRRRTSSLTACTSKEATSPRLACSIPTAISRRNSSWRNRRTSWDSPSQRYNSQRSCAVSCSVAVLTSITVLMLGK